MIKLVISLLLVLIMFNLGRGLFFLLNHRGQDSVAKALTWRISLSLILFSFILILFYFGKLLPHNSLPPYSLPS